MLSNRMAMLGGPETGKTTLIAALVAKYSALTDAPFPEDQRIAKLKELKREQCVNFLFRGPMGVVDLKDEPLTDEAEKWNTNIAAAAKGLRHEPIVYPDKSEIPHRLWADLEFMSHHIETRAKTGSYLRRLSMIDVPGARLDPKSPRFDANAVQTLNDADALIIFIDMTTALKANSDEALRLLASITSIVKEASKNPIYQERFIPASILFTKSDKAVAPDQLFAANDLFFRRYSLPLSRASQRIQVMSCPISVEDSESHLFRPKNIHLPFLFSTMGLLHSEALRAAAVAKGMKSLTFWHRWKIGESVNNLIEQAEKNSKLVEAIRDTLCAEYISGDKNIRFARDGEENFAHQIGFNI